MGERRDNNSTPSVLFDQGDPDAEYPAHPLTSRVWALLTQRCPVCLIGPMFRGIRQRNEKCPSCGHHLLRDNVFHQGVGRYVRRALSTLAISCAFLGVIFLMQTAFPDADLAVAALLALLFEIVIVPLGYRYCRVVWAHLTVPTRRSRPQTTGG